MNCPGHMLAVRQRGAQLSRSAAALPRADAAASQRGVGHAVGPDARAPVSARTTRTASSRRSRSARKSSGCFGSCSASMATSACRSRRSSSTMPAEFLGEAATWDSRRGATEGGARACRAALHAQRRRRRVLRPEDRLRRDRRDRPEVAVRDDSARLSDARALRSEVHRRRQRGASCPS